MKKLLLSFAFSFLFFINLSLAAIQARFTHDPDIYKDKIVFTYEGDLWTVSSSGGTASRLTSFPGDEFAAKFSPDGKEIAFTGSYDGSYNVYVMPVDGGKPKRITYNPGGDQTICWTPDGKRVVFRSYFENFIMRDPNLYFVDKDGSAPERFPLDRGVRCSFSADGSKILYVRKGLEEYNWKRYKGGWYTDIWEYDFKNNQFTPISNYVGKNAYPMWIGKFMYFVSDRGNGIANIFKENLDTKEITQVTNYNDVDVMYPSNDKDQIVYLHDGFLYVLDTKTDQSKKIEVEVPSDQWELRDRVINPKDYIHFTNISNDGKTVALEARGDIFTIPTGKGNTLNLSNSPGTREMYPQISPDGKWVAFFSDKSGEYELYIQSIEGGEWKQLTTTLDRTDYHLLWSPDGKKILFGNKQFAIFYVDVDTKKLVKIDTSDQMKNDEFYWEVSDYNWSPDSKWICYSFVQYNRNNEIFLYSLDQNKKYAITDDFFDNINPVFDASGEYLYYLSSRNFDVQMDFYEDDHIIAHPQQVMVVQLQAGEKPPFEETAMKDEPKVSKDFRIDITGIKERTYPLPVDPGNDFYLKAGNGKVAWCSVPKFTEDEYNEIFKPGGETKWDLHIFDMKDKKEITLDDKIKDFNLSTNGEQLLVQRNADIFTTSMDEAYKSKSAGEKLNLNGMTYTVDDQKEWTQIFNDTWRWYRDFFFDPNMFNLDWKAIGDRYRADIPYLTSRSDLNWLLLQLVGELSVSHTYISGGDMGPETTPKSTVFTGWLGCNFVKDGNSPFYKFGKIYGPTEYNLNLKSPLVRPDIDVKEGDYLIAINGKEIKVPEDYFKYLQVTEGEKVAVTVNNKPSAEGAKTYEVEPIKNNPQLRYFSWLTHNIHKVLKDTHGEVGYMHINAMNAPGIGEFDKFWRAFRYDKGIIIDMRRNSGGWTEYFLIDKLVRKMVAYNVLHHMVPFRYPGSTSTAKYVVISNEYNGSDGEAFIEDFRANHLGKVVGTRSWGGLTGILNTQTTIDNGKVEQSNNGFFGTEGKWWIENHGADPDVEVDNDPASVEAGKDPQLDAAIKTVMQEIKDNPFTFPKQPPYPDKKK
ncbi:MAG: S41 family peptidase [Ignavibacteriaceae bacterium]